VAWLARLALSLAALAGLAEWVTLNWLETSNLSVFSRQLGSVHLPHTRTVQSQEGWSEHWTNSDSLFGPELLPIRPRVRAVLLGDSFAEGLQVAQSQNMSAVAERADPGLEVINGAAAGGFPAHYAAFLPGYEQAFSPDVVVIQVNDGDVNEMGDPTRLADVRRELAAGPAPRRGALRQIIGRSGLIRLSRMRIELLIQRERARLTRKFTGGPLTSDIDDTAGPIPAGATAEADSLFDVITAEAPRIVLVYVPHIFYYASPPAAAYPIRRAFWNELAERHRIPLVDPTDEMLAEYRRTGQPLHGFANTTIATGHINWRAHDIIGRMMARAIEEALR